MQKGARIAAVAASLAAVLCGCGGGGNPAAAPTPTPKPTPNPPFTVLQRSALAIQKGYVFAEPFAIGKTGTLDVTVDYTYQETGLLVWLAKGDCSADMWANEQCNYVATSFAGAKPRKVSANSQPSGNYMLIVGNAGPKDESVSYQVVFTESATAAVSEPAARSNPARGFSAPLPAR